MDKWTNETTKQISRLSKNLENIKINNENGRRDNDDNSKMKSPQKTVKKYLVENKVMLLVKDSVFSVKHFDELKLPYLLLKQLHKLGFRSLSEVQETLLPALLSDPPLNVVVQSLRGSGKTVGFVLAMLQRIDVNQNYPQVLCLAPTYLLAVQIGDVILNLTKYFPHITMKFIVRGEDIPESELTEHILIGTPCKVKDWVVKSNVIDLKKVSMFILSNVDLMIATKGQPEDIIRIQKNISTHCQMLLSFTTYEENAVEFIRANVPNYMMIQQKALYPDNIRQYYVTCKNSNKKYAAVRNIYKEINSGQIILFCNTRKTACWLSQKLFISKYRVALLTGELSTMEMISVLDAFRDGKQKMLVTTNIVARGVRVSKVTVVVNFDLPIHSDTHAVDNGMYLYRTGMAGNFKYPGLVVNIVDQIEVNLLRDIEDHFRKKMTKLHAHEDSDTDFNEDE